MNKKFQEFLKELSNAVDLPGLRPDAHGACLVHFNEKDVSVLFEYDENIVPHTILFSSELASVTQDRLPEILKQTLKQNNDSDETLSLKPNTNTLYLHQRVHSDILSDSLKPAVEHFLTSCAKHKKSLL